jgi:hypothetical protein
MNTAPTPIDRPYRQGASTLQKTNFAAPSGVDVDPLVWERLLTSDADALIIGEGLPVSRVLNVLWPTHGAGDEPLKVGARLLRQSAEGEAVREFRALLERLPETAEDEVAFRLVVDAGALERGNYQLSIDVVKEYQFWLADKGATPRVIPVVIT